MRSTFHGLETLKRAIYAQQYAIYTTGHNIANANAEGYSRQRVNMGTMSPLDPIGVNRSTMPGQLGTGVIVRDVVRLRDAFADTRFRNQYHQYGEWEVRLDTLQKLEVIVNEPSETGLSAAIDEFWDAWQTLSSDPKETPRIVVEKMKSLVEAFNMKAKQLDDLEADLNETLGIKYDRANQLLGQIADMNALITKVESLGDNANDLRDQRDLLVDELSKLVDIRVQTTYDANGQEVYTVMLANDGSELVSGTAVTALEPENQTVAGGEISGLLKSLEKVAQYKTELDTLANTLATGKVEVTLPAGTVLTKDITDVDGTTYPAGTELTEPVKVVVEGVNGLHELGWNGKEPPEPGGPLFVSADGGDITAGNIKVSDDLLKDEQLLAPANRVAPDGSRLDDNNGLALIMAGLRDASFTFEPVEDAAISEGTIGGYYRSYTAKLGVETESAEKELKNQTLALNSAIMQRASVSAVSLDEEMANLIMFQHAYNAAARNMTAIDEMLDRIINGMGHVGR